MPLRLALHQPDIPQNTGTIMRLAACLGLGLDLIEPLGFALDDKKMRRAGMDYLDRLDLVRHAGWGDFCAACEAARARRVLLTTRADTPYTDFTYTSDDVLIVGSESVGVPDDVHADVAARVTVPMVAGLRSLNVAVALAMVTGEALRQTGTGPGRQTGTGPGWQAD